MAGPFPLSFHLTPSLGTVFYASSVDGIFFSVFHTPLCFPFPFPSVSPSSSFSCSSSSSGCSVYSPGTFHLLLVIGNQTYIIRCQLVYFWKPLVHMVPFVLDVNVVHPCFIACNISISLSSLGGDAWSIVKNQTSI
jgi:hypothetical protein